MGCIYVYIQHSRTNVTSIKMTRRCCVSGCAKLLPKYREYLRHIKNVHPNFQKIICNFDHCKASLKVSNTNTNKIPSTMN